MLLYAVLLLLAGAAHGLPCCAVLSSNLVVRWQAPSPGEASLSYSLETNLPPQATYLAFGPAALGAINRLMSGSDVVAAGFDESGTAFAVDMFLNGYAPCSATPPVTGVCPDSLYGGADNVVLVNITSSGGLSTFLLSRPLAAADAAWDVPLSANATPTTFVWAHGSLSPGAAPPAQRLAQHAPGAYGSVSLALGGACTTGCPPPAAAASSPPAPPHSFAVSLAGGGVTLSWTLDGGDATLSARGTVPSGWLSLGVGSGMVGSWAAVAWADAAGALHAEAYTISSLDASGIARAAQQPNASAARSADGTLSLTLTLPLAGGSPALGGGGAAPFLWALGNGWADGGLSDGAQHFARSSEPTIVNLRTGHAELGAAPPPPPLLVAHAALMAVAFAALMPAAAIAARYLRAPGALSAAWFPLHSAAGWAAALVSAAGAAAAVALQAQSGGSVTPASTHAKLGVAAMALMATQVLLATARPKAAAPGEAPGRRRVAWLWAHRCGAAAAIALSIAALFTGLKVGKARGVVRAPAFARALAVWLASLGGGAAVREAARAAAAVGAARASAAGEDKEAVATSPPRGEAAAAVVERRWALAAVGWVSVSALFTILVATATIGSSTTASDSVALLTPSPPPAGAAGAAVAVQPPSPPVPPSPPSSPSTSIPSPIDCFRLLTQPFEQARLGDGWCDAGAPYNSAACGWDGGDCCNTSLPLFDCKDPASPHAGAASPKGLLFPAPLNPRYASPGAGRVLSSSSLVSSYNNFYEFSYQKSVAPLVTPAAASALSLAAGWTLAVDGAVANPITLDVRSLLSQVAVEERIYRHRCVEAWSIVVPWVGFPLRKLLSLVQPLPNASYIRFETATNSAAFPVQASNPGGILGVSWPYVEGISIAEAWNDLAFLSVGTYNATLPPQNGAPIRLTLPWKYGFKSIKSIVRITFQTEAPLNWWKAIAPSEYGFWANVNPAFPHPRWSQATESALSATQSGPRIATTIFNGYWGEVQHLYGTTREYFY